MIDFGNARNMRWVSEVQFTVSVARRDFICRVSQEAIEDHYDGATGEGCLEAAKENFDDITRRAGRKILLRQFEPDGSVLLRTEDLMGP